MSMQVNFLGNTSGLQGSVRQAKNILSSLTDNPLAGVGMGLAIVGVAAIGFGAASVKMAGDYDRSMRSVQALTGANTDQMGKYDSALKSLAINAGVAPTALASGLYNVLSASYKGADAINVLTLATEDAKIGMTSATVTTDALTNVLRSFGTKSQDITRVNGEMLETVTLGKSTFEQYAQAIVKSASASVQFHVSMETMNAAWSTMTSSGIRAAQASTDFQQSLKVMYGNIGAVTKSLEKNGIAFNETKFNAMSYGDKVVYLNKALQEANDKHVKITGVTLQASQAISTIAKHIGDYNSNLQTLSDKQAMANKTQQAWAITQGGFSQSMDRLKAAVQVLMINLGSALLPILTRLVNSITPIITSIATWETKTHGIENALGTAGNVLNQVGDAINKMAGFISNVVSVGAQIVKFFQNSQVAAVALLIPLGALAAILVQMAVTSIVAFIASIPALVTGFIAWTVAAGAAAIATIAATWPLLLIGAAIGLVVAIIILAVTHWGAISKWLTGAWKSALDWLQGALHSIGQFFVSVWNGIKSATVAVWNFLVGIVQAGAHFLYMVIFGPFIAIGALFSWLYDHNTYFKMLIDKITSIVTGGVNWLLGIWKSVTGWISHEWQYLTTLAHVYFTMLAVEVYIQVTRAENFLHSIWTSILNFLGGIWNNIVNNVKTMWGMISGFFASAWSTFIQKPIQNLWNSLVSFVGDWPAKAVQWGINLIQGLINGITGMVGKVGDAVGKIAGKIGSFLGFHSPSKEGPGTELDIWGPNLAKGFAVGIQKGVPLVQAAVNMLMKPVQQQLGSTSSHSTGASSGTSGTQTIIIQLDSTELARITGDRQARMVRLKMGRRAA